MRSLRPPAARCVHGVLHEHSWDRPHPEHHAQPWTASCSFASSTPWYRVHDLPAVIDREVFVRDGWAGDIAAEAFEGVPLMGLAPGADTEGES